MLRFIRWSSFALLGLLAAVWAVFFLGQRDPGGPAGRITQRAASWIGAHPAPGAVALPPGIDIGGPFTLTDTTGRQVTDQDFRGRWMLIYFGYTFCPDVCPTELQTVAAALDRLGPDAARIAPIFITIDPERDTQAVLADYVKVFDQRLIGLTGSPDQIEKIAHEYRVYYAKVTPVRGGGYVMDHSSFLYLVGPEGRLRELIRPGDSPSELAEAIGQELRRAND